MADWLMLQELRQANRDLQRVYQEAQRRTPSMLDQLRQQILQRTQERLQQDVRMNMLEQTLFIRRRTAQQLLTPHLGRRIDFYA